jgi:uncharacterized membrane protein YkvA (DUF1232 family)
MGVLLLIPATVVAIWIATVLVLVLLGRRTGARALAGFVPDCMILVRRLLGDARIPRGTRLLLGAVLVYLALPIDLVPDFVPVAGQLDDAILLALALRRLVRMAGADLVHDHWPGPPAGRDLILRLAGAA